jgi:phage shock protein A
MAKVDTELRRIEQRVKKFDQEAREAVHRKDKNAALQALRKKKRVEKEMTDKDAQYQRLVGMLEQLAASKQTREILDAYKSATKAYKDALERQGLTVDNVDTTIDAIHDAIQDANDLDEAISHGFSSMPMPASHIDDSVLEAELNSLIEEEGAIKKREPVVSNLPSVPSGRLIDTSDVERRLKKLREGLQSN